MRKFKQLGRLHGKTLLFSVDVGRLEPSIPHGDGLDTSRVKLEQREDKSLATENLFQM